MVLGQLLSIVLMQRWVGDDLEVGLLETLFKLKALGKRKNTIQYQGVMQFLQAVAILFNKKIMVQNTAQNVVQMI